MSSIKYKRASGSYETENKSEKILFRAFIAFSLVAIMFVVYFAVDHYIEKNSVDNDIENLKKELDKFRSEESENCENEEFCKEVQNLVAKARRQDRKTAIINLMRNMMNSDTESESDDLLMWSKVPRSFIHLNATKLHTTKIEGTVENMDTLVGWKKIGGEDDVNDPMFEEHQVTITLDGNYSIFSRITFKCPDAIEDNHPATVHRHVVQFIETFANFVDDPKILMDSAYLMCGKSDKGKSKVSQQGGVFRFMEGDMLSVLVKKDVDTEIHSEDGNFGIALL